MSPHFFVFNAPPFSLTKETLYSTEDSIKVEGMFIKAISDAFFLSNEFRKSLYLYYCTTHKSKPYIINFNGANLRYLGPSFFSAAHLLLRAINHIIDPTSKSGKLTPGLNIFEGSYEWILEKHIKDNCLKIIRTEMVSNNHQRKICESNVFLFGFDNINLPKTYGEVSLGPIDIDEQVILTNYNLEMNEK
ncbi:MAG: hypothetical protein KAS52_04190 [Candidatus Heimdallarchaeota archaeon]|nr:hypothetical protein [Candidatus Heimdallarchaeota archaeon]